MNLYDGDRDRAAADEEVVRRRAEKQTGPRKRLPEVEREAGLDGHSKPGAWRNQPTCKGKTVGELEDDWERDVAADKAGTKRLPTFMELLEQRQRERSGGAA